MRNIGARTWEDVQRQPDRSRPGHISARCPPARTITLFFYDGPISQAVAFEKLLDSGERFAHRLESGFSDSRQMEPAAAYRDGRRILRPSPQVRRHGACLRASLYRREEDSQRSRITANILPRIRRNTRSEIYAKIPPGAAYTAWSAGRATAGATRADIPDGTRSGGRRSREALDWLRDLIAPLFEAKAGEYLRRSLDCHGTGIST